MVIQKSTPWWKGDEPTDLEEYLRHYSRENYPATEFVHASCAACGGTAFGVRLDDEAGAAARCCDECGDAVVMLDSAESSAVDDMGDATCPCGSDTFNVAVGFAHYHDGEIRWVYVGLRCTDDGTLGCYTDWKIDYTPSSHLREQV